MGKEWIGLEWEIVISNGGYLFYLTYCFDCDINEIDGSGAVRRGMDGNGEDRDGLGDSHQQW